MSNGITEWWNQNAHRSFPFFENSDFRLSNGKLLPTWVLIDLSLIDTRFLQADHPTLKATGFSFTEDDDSYKIRIDFAYAISSNSDANLFFLEGSFQKQGKTVRVVSKKLSDFPDSHGTAPFVKAVLGIDCDDLDSVELGTFSFEKNPEILPSRILLNQDASGIDSIKCISKEKTGDLETEMKGIVHLRDGYNCRLRIVSGNIKMDVSRGAGLGEYCYVDEKSIGCADSLLFLNGQSADPNGNINIVGGPGVSVSTDGYLYKGTIPTVKIGINTELKSLFK